MASRSLGALTVDLIAKIAGFEQGLDRAARVAEDRSRRIDRTMRGLGRTITTVFAALGGAALVRQVVRATIEQENALRQLETRILSTGSAAGKTAGDLTAFANQLQKITTYEDDAIVAAQGLLLSFTNIRGAVFDRVTESALDLAAATGQDLPAAFRTLGIAVNDPVKGISRLTRAGIQLDDSQVKLIKRLAETGQVTRAQGILLDEISKRFGGSARAAADTFGGSLLQLKNAFGELFEAPGGLNEAKKALQEFTALLQDPATVAAAGALTSTLIHGFAKVGEVISGVNILLTGASPFEFEEEIARLQRAASSISREIQSLEMDFAPDRKWIEELRSQLDEANAEIERFKAKQLESFGGAPSVTGATAPMVDPVLDPLGMERMTSDVQAWANRTRIPVLVSPTIELDTLPDAQTRDVQAWAERNKLELLLTPEIDLLDVETEMAKMDTTFEDFSESMGRGLHDTLVDAFLGVETSFGDLLKRMAAELLTSSLLKSFGSVFAGATGPWGKLAAGLFGGARAEGGPVTAGMSYLVGERGPEFFRPKVSGMVTAADGGGVTLYQTYHIDARGAESSLVNRLPSILEQQRRRGLADARDEMRRGRLR